jgi:phosphoglycerate dehydrogenase-like enzyme
VSVPTEELAAALRPYPQGAEVIVWEMTSPPPREAIDLVVPPYMSMDAVMPRLAGVRTRLVQSQSIGYEGIADHLPAGHVFANASSVHETSTAELAVGLAIAAQRRLPTYVRAQDEARWAPEFSESLADRRVLLLGFGGVGRAVASRLAPFEVELTVVASRARFEDGMRVHGVERLLELLPHAEIVIATLPGGEATHHILGVAALAALPDGALIVNVGRGPLIDTDALVSELQRGRLRAALDVTDPEPLPADHWLRSNGNAIVTPHVAFASAGSLVELATRATTNALITLAGGRPASIINPEVLEMPALRAPLRQPV